MKVKTVHIGLVGDSKTGKTCLARLFVSNGSCMSRDYHLTSGVEIFTKIVSEVNADEGPYLLKHTEARRATEFELMNQVTHLKVKLFDFGGSQIYREHIVLPVLTNIENFIMVFDVSSRKSFKGLKQWKNIIEKHSKGYKKLIVIGNKNDFQIREVMQDEARQMAKRIGAQYFETSLKQYESVEASFNQSILFIRQDSS